MPLLFFRWLVVWEREFLRLPDTLHNVISRRFKLTLVENAIFKSPQLINADVEISRSYLVGHSFPSRFHSPALGGVVTIFGRGWGAPGALPPTGPAQSAATRLCLLAVCTLLITQVVAHCLSRVPRTAMLTDWNERLWECKWSRLIRCRVGRWSQPYVIADSPSHPTWEPPPTTFFRTVHINWIQDKWKTINTNLFLVMCS